MKNALKLKLSVRLIVSILGSVFVMLTLLLSVLGIKLYNNSKEEGIKHVASQSHEVATKVENYLDKSFETMNSLRNVSMAMKNSKTSNRDQLIAIMQEILNNNKNYLAIWSMWEENKFDGKDNLFKHSVLYNKNNGAFSITYYKNNNTLVNEPANTSQYNETYYTLPKTRKANTLLEPYYYSYVGDTTQQFFETSVVVPVMDKNEVIGVVAVDIELGILGKIIAPTTVFKSGFASIVTNQMQIAAHKDNTLVTQKLFSVNNNDTLAIASTISKGEEYYTIGENKNNQKTLRYFSPVHIAGTNTPWSVMIEVPLEEVTAQARNIIELLVIIGIIGLVIFTIIIIYISRSITKPIIKAANFVQQITNGDLTQEISSTQKDEIGLMINNLQLMSGKIRSVVADIVSSSANISNAGVELNYAAQQLSEGANEQAASTEEVSSSMEEMVSNINQNADNAQQTQHIAIKASTDIEDGSKAVFSTLEAMKKIAEKITIIGEIAEKTDLLAINAAIEAARAGEHGKGFAVVATEVRKLAERSQSAAKEINELSKSSVKIADESGIVLQKIVPDIKHTALLVQEISAASMEQNSGAGQINNAILQLNTVTQRNATAAEEISANAEELVQQADSLIGLVSFFKTGIEVLPSKARFTRKAPASAHNTQHAVHQIFKNNTSTPLDIQLPVDEKEPGYEKF